MKKDWEIKKLVELGVIQTGTTPSTRNKEFYGDFIPFVKPPHFSLDGTINYKDEGLSEIGLNKGRLIKENSILMVCIGATIGKTGITSKPVSCNQQINSFTPKEDLEPKYFYYLLSSSIFFDKVKKLASQATLPMINKTKWKNIEVSYPKSLKEQQQIVAILDKALTAIATAKANAEQNLLNAKQLFESYLQNIFENKGDDWEEKTLEQISRIFGRGKSKHRPRNDKKLYGGDYPFIQTGDIRNSEHSITNFSQTYNEVGLAQSKLWPKGTICITIAANIAETGILSFDACFPDSIIGIVVNDEFANIDFVEYLLQSFKVNLQALSKGSAQDNINLGTFKNKLFPFPSIQEQQQIVKKLNNLSAQTKKLEAIYQQKSNDLEELKKSVLQKAFNGELT